MVCMCVSVLPVESAVARPSRLLVPFPSGHRAYHNSTTVVGAGEKRRTLRMSEEGGPVAQLSRRGCHVDCNKQLVSVSKQNAMAQCVVCVRLVPLSATALVCSQNKSESLQERRGVCRGILQKCQVGDLVHGEMPSFTRGMLVTRSGFPGPEGPRFSARQSGPLITSQARATAAAPAPVPTVACT